MAECKGCGAYWLGFSDEPYCLACQTKGMKNFSMCVCKRCGRPWYGLSDEPYCLACRLQEEMSDE